MRNVNKNQLKKCIFLVAKEFVNVCEEIFEGYGVTHYPDGFDIIHLNTYECLAEEEIYKGLSEYYDINVTSIHIDHFEDIGFWIVYKESEVTNYEV